MYAPKSMIHWEKHEFSLPINEMLSAIQRRTMQSTRNLFRSLEKDGYVIGGGKTQYCYKDNGASVLAVAHADSVQTQRFFRRAGNTIFSPSLDDRLGVAVACDILPMMGACVDVLITDGEESAQSSARHFNPEKKYNWIVEFDRAGTDVVVYDYDSIEWADAIKKSFGAPPDRGIYTDLCEMYGLGCCGMNVGIGYENYHSINASADLVNLEANLIRFSHFFEANRDTLFAFEERPVWDRCGWGRFDTPMADIFPDYMCPECYEEFGEAESWWSGSFQTVGCPCCGAVVSKEEATRMLEDSVCYVSSRNEDEEVANY